MGGLFYRQLPQLLGGLQGQGGVALHDPPGDVLVPLPGGVLDHDPAVFFRPLVGQAHSVVIVQFGDGGVGSQGPDVLQPLQGRALGHVDHRLLPQAVGGPGHAPAVVAVGGGDEGDIPQLFPSLLAGHPVVGELADIHPQPPGQVAADGEAAPQHLEGVETEAVAFVLDIDPAQAQFLCQAGKIGQGGD